MASAAVRALAKVRTPRVTLEQLTGEVADRRRAGAYLHGVLPPLLLPPSAHSPLNNT